MYSTGKYAHSSSTPTTTRCIYWNDGKPSFVNERKGKRQRGAASCMPKKDIWRVNEAEAPEPFCSERIHGKWILTLELRELTEYWHLLQEMLGTSLKAVKMVCPPKKVRSSRTEKPVFHVYTSREGRASAGGVLVRVVKRDIVYEAEEEREGEGGRGSVHRETLYWNDGKPDTVSAVRQQQATAAPASAVDDDF